MKKIIWFTNSHEQRNHLLKYGLMKIAQSGKIKFLEQHHSQLLDYDLPESIKKHKHRHTSFLLFINGNQTKKILVDSEDSFIHLQDLIKDIDIYFCSAYNHDFHVEKRFIQTYSWQTDDDIVEYKRKSRQLILDFGDHFYKIRKFIPIGFDLFHPIKYSYIEQKFINVRSNLVKSILNQKDWKYDLQMFELRYNYVQQLRDRQLEHDIVLYDTLWGGWPRHRYSLHRKLQGLSKKYNIYSVLKWDSSAENSEFKKDQFPLISKPIQGNYEEMLSASRLGVFATGFHWGWRNIMTLALFLGIPIYMDKPVFEPYFDFNEFQIFYNTDNWKSLQAILNQIDYDLWLKIKSHNQKLYDKYLSPEKVADYFINSLNT